MKNYGHFKHIEGIFQELIWESFTNARHMRLNFQDAYELADGIEVDMQEDFRNRLNIGDDDFDTNDCEWIIAHNAYDMLALQAAVKKLGLPYKFDALDPVAFTEDFLCLLIHEYVLDFVFSSGILTDITESKFTFDRMADYIFEHEFDVYIEEQTGEKIPELVYRLINKAKADS